MFRDVYDLKSFYKLRAGLAVRQILRRHIAAFWPDLKGFSLMGAGYASPYLRPYAGQVSRIFTVMPAGRGVHPWEQNRKNLSVLAEDTELPFETNSIDRILLVHSLEFAEMLRPALSEYWRVLKSNGRMLVIVPNRTGFWARADWSPFGYGTPYTRAQLSWYLRDNRFVYERGHGALFMPPIRWRAFLDAAAYCEVVGPWLYPIFAGVHIVEVSKQIYAGTQAPVSSSVQVRGRGFLAPEVVRSAGYPHESK